MAMFAHDLEDVVLDDVADGTGLVVEGASPLDAEVFGHGDLNALDEVAVPEGFEEGVGEAEGDDVVDGAFGEVVVDAEDGRLGEGGEEDAVELRAEARSWPKGFSTIMRAPLAEPDWTSCSTTFSKSDGGMAR